MVLANFREYAASTSFARTLHAGNVTDSPAHRIDCRHWDADPDWNAANFMELSVSAGDRVTLYAACSRDRGGIVAHATEPAWLWLGDDAQAMSHLGEERRHGVQGVLFFLFLALAIVGGYQVYVTWWVLAFE